MTSLQEFPLLGNERAAKKGPIMTSSDDVIMGIPWGYPLISLEDYQWSNSRSQSANRMTGSSSSKASAHGYWYINKRRKTGFDKE